MKDVPVTVYWFANGVRVAMGKHETPNEFYAEAGAVCRQFESLSEAQKTLQPSNRAQGIISHMLEQMK